LAHLGGDVTNNGGACFASFFTGSFFVGGITSQLLSLAGPDEGVEPVTVGTHDLGGGLVTGGGPGSTGTRGACGGALPEACFPPGLLFAPTEALADEDWDLLAFISLYFNFNRI